MFANGMRLGAYEILAPIGAGGMGEVYRSRDTRLDRTVAIKVLPAHLSGDAELRQRFEREARAVSSLNHPHICVLHDIGQQDGIDFLVMEYLEGETLAERLKKGPIPMDQGLRYAVEIADALEKAHRHGVVHRDLKPGNIMLTKSGTKLLDFGLAKLRSPETGPTAGLSALATGAANLTGAGTILGTFQYMAPEQLEGKEADARTDIFAFGAVVYEMVTARKAFVGKSQASLIGAILKDEPPPISTLQPLSPPALGRVLKHCLAKDPDDRWQTAHDVMLELKFIGEGVAQPDAKPETIARTRKRERMAWISVSSLLLLAVLALAIGRFPERSAESPSMKFQVFPPENAFFEGIDGYAAVSPDGSRIAFVATDSQARTLLYVRPLDSLAAQALPGTEGASFPFWSPDGRSLGFFAQSKLKRIALAGGPPQSICDSSDARGGTWNRDGTIVFSNFAELLAVPSGGGDPKPIVKPDPSRKEDTLRWPYFLPDGRHFLYWDRSWAPETRGLHVASLDSADTSRVLNVIINAIYAPPGYLLFWREGALLAQPFDAERLKLSGQPVTITGDAGFSLLYNRGFFSSSENGVLVYQSASGNSQLVWFDRQGRQLGTVGEPASINNPALSPDGKSVAADFRDSASVTGDIVILDLATGVPSRFTFDPSYEGMPVWSADGKQILFSSSRLGSWDLYVKDVSGRGTEDLLVQPKSRKWANDWSRDGRYIVFENLDPETKSDVWALPLFGDRKPFPLLHTAANEKQAQISPDGRWLAYVSDESGSYRVYVTSFPKASDKWQVSTDVGAQPQWRRDGKELFYLAGDKRLMAVGIKGGSFFQAEAAKPLFQVRVLSLMGDRTNYAASADGQQFLVVSLPEKAVSSPLTVVVNWPAGLKR